MRYLTFALGKGRLAKQTLELFEKIGITCEEMKDKDSRKLIFVNEELKPQKVRIRVYGEQVDYLRTLPLHRSQEEVLCKYEEYSDFQYTLCLTPEFISQLLMMGDNIEVLEPQELREEMKKKIENCLTRYK